VRRDGVINVHLDADLCETRQLILTVCTPLAGAHVVTRSAADSKANYGWAASPEEFRTTSRQKLDLRGPAVMFIACCITSDGSCGSPIVYSQGPRSPT